MNFTLITALLATVTALLTYKTTGAPGNTPNKKAGIIVAVEMIK